MATRTVQCRRRGFDADYQWEKATSAGETQTPGVGLRVDAIRRLLSEHLVDALRALGQHGLELYLGLDLDPAATAGRMTCANVPPIHKRKRTHLLPPPFHMSGSFSLAKKNTATVHGMFESNVKEIW
jgi:hypothetical protein